MARGQNTRHPSQLQGAERNVETININQAWTNAVSFFKVDMASIPAGIYQALGKSNVSEVFA